MIFHWIIKFSLCNLGEKSAYKTDSIIGGLEISFGSKSIAKIFNCFCSSE